MTFVVGWRNVVESVSGASGDRIRTLNRISLGKSGKNLAYEDWQPLGQDLHGQRHPRLLFSSGDLARVVQRVTQTQRCLMRDNRLPRMK